MADNKTIDCTEPLKFHQWLIRNIGGPQCPGFYVREGELVRVPRIGEDGYRPLTDNVHDEDGPAQIRPADTTAVRAVLARNFTPIVMKQDREGNWGEVEVLPPHDPVNLYVAGVAEPGNAAPRLDGVVHTPFLRPDGSIRIAPGYDSATRLLLLPPAGLTLPAVPDQPSSEDVAMAAKTLLHLISEFPFVTDDDRANFVGALLIGPLLRPLVKPPYPIVALSAHMAGSGKSLLASVSMELHGGVFRSEPSHHDEEVRKLITSLLRCTSAPVVVLDNLTGTFRSGQFAAMATSAVWSDRPLGSTAQVEAPNDRIWVLTGNNIVLGGDLPRRVPIWCRIDADQENPHLRNGFKIPDLIGHIRDNRGGLLAAALTIVRAWIVAGRPLAGPERHDSFGTWIRSVAGILEVAGIDGTFASQEILDETAVLDEDAEAGEFLQALRECFPDGFQARDVAARIIETRDKVRRKARADSGDQWTTSVTIDAGDERLLDTLPEDLVGKIDNAGFGKSLGRWLTYRRGQWKSGHVLRASNDRTRTKRFHVERRAPGDGGGAA